MQDINMENQNVNQNKMEAKLIKKDDIFYLYIDESWSIASTDTKDNRDKKLSLKNCQAIENGYDLDELVLDYEKENEEYIQVDERQRQSFKEGFQKALEIFGDKKFTNNQMVSAITESSISHRLPSLIIQDLQQTEWDVEIVMENKPYKYLVTIGEVTTSKLEPKLDSDNCIILKRK